MRIGLLNLEPHYTNIALEKLRKYHLGQGCIVEDCSPIESNGFDIVYCSSIFDFTSKKYITPDFIRGGTGFNLTTTLPQEIDNITLQINRGFTTRGCIRNCKFCVVPQKEGGIRAVGDLLEIWDTKAKEVVLYDNNILAMPEHFAYICSQARENKICIDFNQGLDHRLLTQEVVDILKSISHHEYRFAFDHPSLVKTVDRAIGLLQANGINRCSWYVLVGFDTTLDEDLFRLNYLRDRNQIAFVQRYRKDGVKVDIKKQRQLTALARWANQHHIYRGMTWEQFLKHPENKGYAQLFC